MWMMIMLGMLIASILVMIFLVTRFRKFHWIIKFAGKRKGVRTVLALSLTAILFVLLVYTMGPVNTAIVLIHLGIIWGLCDLAEHFWLADNKVSQKCYVAGVCALLFTTVYLGCGWYLAHHVWEQDYEITTEKTVGNLRVVQFADSHVGSTFHADGFEKHLEAIQQLQPDIVLITGDYVDDDTSKEDMVGCCEALGRLKTTYGVYYAFGNHDKGYYGNEYRGYSGDDLIHALEKNGVRVLQDETVLIDDRFYIVGRQDRSERQRGNGRASMDELMRGLDPDKFSIVLDHQPYEYPEQEAAGADLVLSGHTHGGQLFPVNHMGEWTHIDAKTYGYEKRGNTNFIVTSGISDWAIKFRTGCRAEFVVVDIVGK